MKSFFDKVLVATCLIALIGFAAYVIEPGIVVAQSTQNLAGERNVVVLGGDENKVIMNPISAATMSYTAAATGTVVAISDRHAIMLHHVGATGEGAWIAINSAVATAAQGIPVYPGAPLTLEIGSAVPISWAASGAVKLVITQTSRP